MQHGLALFRIQLFEEIHRGISVYRRDAVRSSRFAVLEVAVRSFFAIM
jgi:hypothetical protein